MKIKNFVPFYFEGNMCWGFIETPEQIFDFLLKNYTFEQIRKAKVNPDSLYADNFLKFGFYSEYNGDLTLGEWFDKNQFFDEQGNA